jgi:hypothetical protein
MIPLELAAGARTVNLLVGGSGGGVRVELADVPDSPAQVQIVGGK